MENGSRRSPVAIIGAGVSGLTCGVVLAERGFRVTIFAREFTPNTTSDIPAAIWYPHNIEPKDQVDAWTASTLEELQRLAETSGSGVSIIEFRIFSKKKAKEKPNWARDCGYRALTGSELPAGYTSGYSIQAPLMETPQYLVYLQRRFKRAGGSLVQRSIEGITELGSEYPIIVNCSGLGARELCRDPTLREGRGVILVGQKPALKHAIADLDHEVNLTYIVPRSRDCVIGGLDDPESHRPTATRREVSAILKRAKAVHEDLMATGRVKVGMRPVRDDGVKLEIEELNGCTVVHNYGHGGAGFTVSWGCAERVAELVQECIGVGLKHQYGGPVPHKSGLSEEARTRLLMHGMHEETIFYNRLNFFFLIEALLLSAVITAYSGKRPAPQIMFQSIAAVGALTSFIWLLVQLDKLLLVNTLVRRLKKAAPEFDETIRQNRWAHVLPATNTLAWAIPVLFLGVWLVLLIVMLCAD